MDNALNIEAIRGDLRSLEKRIKETRAGLADETRQADRVDRDWEEMIRAHAKIQEAVQASGSMMKLVIEGLRLDADILKFSLRRWVLRHDHKFRGALTTEKK
jgi:hypothetical protein